MSQLLGEELKQYGFQKVHSKILDSYVLDISRHEEERYQIVCTIQTGNQYVYIRQDSLFDTDDKNLVTVYNADYSGPLKINFLLELYHALTGSRLEKKEEEDL